MVINMNESRLTTIEQVEAFLRASASINFKPNAGGDCERYAHISAVLRHFDYPRRCRRERGVLLAYLRHTSGYSRSQMTRLVVRWQENRLASVPLAKRLHAQAAPFPRKYTPCDVALLVEMDRANEDGRAGLRESEGRTGVAATHRRHPDLQREHPQIRQGAGAAGVGDSFWGSQGTALSLLLRRMRKCRKSQLRSLQAN
jgi:hypothetical protein